MMKINDIVMAYDMYGQTTNPVRIKKYCYYGKDLHLILQMGDKFSLGQLSNEVCDGEIEIRVRSTLWLNSVEEVENYWTKIEQIRYQK